MIKFDFAAIGTTWHIDINKNLSQEKQSKLLKKINNRIEEFDKNYSRFRPDSLVTKISQKINSSESIPMPADAEPLFSLYQKLYKLTNGLFTPLIGQVLVDAGYDAQYSLKEKKLTPPKAFDEVVRYNYPVLKLKEPTLLDFGAAGKGYLIDSIGELLETENINSYCIDAGGDTRYRTNKGKSLRVGLENPDNTNQVIGVLPITNQSICASAGNRRKWGRFHHIFNPHLLMPVDTILSTWVIAETTILADALATCLFLVSSDILYTEYDFEYLILYPDFSIKKSEGFNAELF